MKPATSLTIDISHTQRAVSRQSHFGGNQKLHDDFSACKLIETIKLVNDSCESQLSERGQILGTTTCFDLDFSADDEDCSMGCDLVNDLNDLPV
jgi:hypothetical protein